MDKALCIEDFGKFIRNKIYKYRKSDGNNYWVFLEENISYKLNEIDFNYYFSPLVIS